jgi:hypothetical protein
MAGGPLFVAVVAADLVEQARGRQEVDVVAGMLGPGAGLAVTGDRAIDDARVDRLHRLVADAQLVHHAGAEAFEDHVGIPGQAQEGGHAGGLLEVEAQAFLVAIDHAEEDAVAAFASGGALTRTHGAGVVAGARVLDLDHLGAEVGQMHGRHRPGQQAREVEHADARERAGSRHRLSHTCARPRSPCRHWPGCPPRPA